jgi:hypothetical protein
MATISDTQYIDHVAYLCEETRKAYAEAVSSEDDKTQFAHNMRRKGKNPTSRRPKSPASSKAPTSDEHASLNHSRHIAYLVNKLKSIHGPNFDTELPPRKTRAECKSFSKKRARERDSKACSSDDE